MTGRGIDQILAYPNLPEIHEPYMDDAREYVALAEAKSGPIPRGVSPEYIWGEALELLERLGPEARIVNLETAITHYEEWTQKGINYRMNPRNISCLSKARLSCCTLANNHVLDWGTRGLIQTLETLENAGIQTCGAGRNRIEAERPAEIPLGGGNRLLVFGLGAESSGIPADWAARGGRAGLAFVKDFSEQVVRRIAGQVARLKGKGDLVLVSIHWGSNWGYEIEEGQVRFAHQLIDQAGVDLIHGHSSHHPRAIEIHRDKLILHGCGDFINDYEGIRGYEEFRGDLGIMYFPELDVETGRLVELRMIPTQMRRFQVVRASRADSEWMRDILNREGAQFATRFELNGDGVLKMHWDVGHGQM